jgi:predicted metal-dependent hydrolase
VKKSYKSGETHLFHGNQSVLKVEKTGKSYVRFYDNAIEMGTEKTDDTLVIKRLLYKGYKTEALKYFPDLLNKVLIDHGNQMFKPAGLVIRTMKRRWGSCSNKGVITLSTELIKLSDVFIEYVITHELCHLKHHNHGPQFYKLLSEVYPEWKTVRKELRKYIQ